MVLNLPSKGSSQGTCGAASNGGKINKSIKVEAVRRDEEDDFLIVSHRESPDVFDVFAKNGEHAERRGARCEIRVLQFMRV